MHPGIHAAKNPDKPALVMAGSGETLAYGELDRRSNRLARLWWDAGLRRGDRVAVFMENHPRYFEVVWAALRSGLYLTAVNSHLQPAEAAYILNDCGARSLVSSRALARVVEGFARDIPRVEVRLMVDAAAAGFASYEREVERFPAEPLEEEPLGDFMLYSSGTTGRRKGVRRPLSGRTAAEGLPLVPLLAHVFGLDASSVYLSPAPLYHAAPLGFTTATQALGGTVVVLERFDAEAALAAIARYRVTHSQWVPTMFQRLLRLPEETKRKYDLSSHRVAIHAAAPCPVHLKERMMEWWGPILHEYYGATEGHGLTCVGPEEWLRHKGTVGKPVVGTLHIVDEQGRECPPGAVGTVYFESPVRFEYHGDPAKTKAAYHERGWSTVGDVGYVDEEGYLYLTDRKDFVIISGGVNIYPQEVENVLAEHPKVADAAVFGVPNEEYGQEVKAVVQLVEGSEAGPEVAAEIVAFCRERLAHYKCPRSIEFAQQLPRTPTGKLAKHELLKRTLTPSQ